ncbi:Hypothetical predicted protein [Octopus vulgaris]|uniref:Uncharacterized protein n=1 Tax=Octopus vulgaris TaxID=6645 RepID=A0AA36BKR2_OCTVU|nr:Hypothetical predicted protein [Octopus vulgaris]
MREVASQKHKSVEKLLNAHMGMLCNMFQLKKQTAHNFQASNNDVPTLCGLRKDHKPYISPVMGPPTRPVCGANISSNYRLSYFLSHVLRPLIEMSPDVCVNMEDLSKISTCNYSNDLTCCVVDSMDVISLYPSIDIDCAVEKFIEAICESEVEFREELGLLLRLSYDSNYLNDHDLSKFSPSRSQRGRPPTITSAVKKSSTER